MEPTYSIIRTFHPNMHKAFEVVATGLSLEDAQQHCSDNRTATSEYFDGYTQE